MAYSKDLRERVLSCVAEHRDKAAAARRYKAHEETVRAWVKVCVTAMHTALKQAKLTRGKDLLTPQGISSAMTLEGSLDSLAFEAYIEHFLLPTLQPGQTVPPPGSSSL